MRQIFPRNGVPKTLNRETIFFLKYTQSTWQMLEKQGDHFFFIKFPQQNYVLYNIIFFLLIPYYFRRKTRTRTKFWNTSVPNSVYAPPFWKKSFYVPYPYLVFGNNPSPFRFRTRFENEPVYVTFPYPYMGTGTESVRIPYPYSGVWAIHI